jgi:hypothetical protein
VNSAKDAALEAVNVTALHARRIVAALAKAIGQTRREVSDLVWDYNDLAGGVRRRKDRGEDRLAEVVPIDLRRRQAN